MCLLSHYYVSDSVLKAEVIVQTSRQATCTHEAYIQLEGNYNKDVNSQDNFKLYDKCYKRKNKTGGPIESDWYIMSCLVVAWGRLGLS